MSIKFTGDFAALKRWEKKLASSPELLRVLNKALAEETVSLIQDGISRGEDPYGQRYDPLVLRSGRPLQDTGGLKSSWHRTHTKSGFSVASGKSYAIFHQKGTGIHGPKGRPIKPKTKKALRIPVRGGGAIFRKSVKGTPKRRMIPDRGLPRRWSIAYRDTANEVFLSHFRK